MEEALRGPAHRAAPRRLASPEEPSADFGRGLADPVDPAIASAQIASGLRRGADDGRVTVAVTVLATNVVDALAIAWNAFRTAAGDDVTGWEVAAAAAQVQPEPPLSRAGGHADLRSFVCD